MRIKVDAAMVEVLVGAVIHHAPDHATSSSNWSDVA
jgi:hypothetical protein